jgi:hypothetical protein
MLIIFLILSLLGWIYLTQASHVATTSRRNQELEAEKARLQQENMELMVEIAAYESVSRLAARAEELGFVAVTPDSVDFMAVVSPALGADERASAPSAVANAGRPQGLQGAVAQVRSSESGSHPGVSKSNVFSSEASPVESTEAQLGLSDRALIGVKSQFAAWIADNARPRKDQWTNAVPKSASSGRAR